MSNNDQNGMFTDSNSFNPTVNNIPLSDVDTRAKGQGSIGDLVKDASSQISSLVRSEVELAKTEVATSAKKAGIGIGLFAAAAIILAYSSFFLFFTIAESLDNGDSGLPRWLAFLIVFLFMIVLVAILGLIGLKQVKQVKKPEKTIESVGELKSVVPARGGNAAARAKDHRDPGMFS